MTKIQYPTEEEMEAMYEEFIKSGSFSELFDEIPFQSYNIIKKKIIY